METDGSNSQMSSTLEPSSVPHNAEFTHQEHSYSYITSIKNCFDFSKCYKGNNIFGFIIFAIIILLTIWAIVQETREYDSITNIIPYSNNPDPSFYGCKAQNKVVWREALIGSVFSTILVFFFLYVLNFPISVFLFILFTAVVFAVYYALSNFRNYHWYKEVCDASKS